MSDRDELSAVVGAALVDHEKRWTLRHHAFERGEPDWRAKHPSTEILPAHVGDALLASGWLRARDARVAAEALEAAAAAVAASQPILVASWLRARAAEYRTTDDDEERGEG